MAGLDKNRRRFENDIRRFFEWGDGKYFDVWHGGSFAYGDYEEIIASAKGTYSDDLNINNNKVFVDFIEGAIENGTIKSSVLCPFHYPLYASDLFRSYCDYLHTEIYKKESLFYLRQEIYETPQQEGKDYER